MARQNERTHPMSVVKDIVTALKSKRVILAAVTAIIISVNQQLHLMKQILLSQMGQLVNLHRLILLFIQQYLLQN